MEAREEQLSQVSERLDKLIGLVSVAFSDQINEFVERLREDQVKAAILDVLSEDWQKSTELQKAAAKKAGVSERAVRNHLRELVKLGLLQTQGGARSSTYRSAGIAELAMSKYGSHRGEDA